MAIQQRQPSNEIQPASWQWRPLIVAAAVGALGILYAIALAVSFGIGIIHLWWW